MTETEGSPGEGIGLSVQEIEGVEQLCADGAGDDVIERALLIAEPAQQRLQRTTAKVLARDARRRQPVIDVFDEAQTVVLEGR